MKNLLLLKYPNVRVTGDEVSAWRGSEPVGEVLQLEGIVEPWFDSEPIRDRHRCIACTLEVRGVNVDEAGVP